MSIGGTNNKIKAQNKQINKQYDYDRKFFDYSWQQSLDNFTKSKQLTNLNRANDKAATDYKNQTAKDNFRYQNELQVQAYRDETAAYNRSVGDYQKQRGLNRQAARISLESERRVRDEALIANNFGLREDQQSFSQTQAELRYNKAQQDNALRTARTDTKLNQNQIRIQQKGQDAIFRQEQKNYKTDDRLFD